MSARRKDENNNDMMTEKEESLCRAMLVSKDQSEALRRSLYETDNMTAAAINRKACDMFRKSHIRSRVAHLIEERAKESKIDAKWVLKEAQDLYKECRKEGDRAQANKALDTIGKHVDVQAWSEKKEIVGTLDVNAKYSILGVKPVE